jgi:hypothetical membrane protein
MSERTTGITGIAATILFWVALFVFGAIEPGYSHFTKAVSELGAIGSANGTAWNVIGFLVPGLMLGVCGAGLATAIDGRRGLLWWSLVVSGLAFAGTGIIPAEMQDGNPMMQSPFTLGHIIMSSLSGILWFVAVFTLPSRAKINPAWIRIRPAAVMIGTIAVAGFGMQIFAQALPYLEFRPGLAQRLSFASYFLWFFVISCYLLFAARQTENDNHRNITAT